MPTSAADIETLVRTVIGEAEGEGPLGQAAVAYVPINRLRTPGWWTRDRNDGIPDDTIQAACLDPKQFSCWNGGPRTDTIKQIRIGSSLYQRVLLVVLDVLSGKTPDPTLPLGGATHYKVIGTKASWDRSTAGKPSLVLGKHIFFNLGLKG